MHTLILIGFLAQAWTWVDPAFMAASGKKTTYDVFVAAGQSNMQGYSPGSPAAPTVPSGVGYLWLQSSNSIVDVATQNPVSFSGTTNGLLNPFVLQYNALTGNKVIIIYAAVSGSGVIPSVSYSGGNWSDTWKTNATVQWTNCINYLRNSGLTYRWRGTLWCQGEQEALPLQLATTTSNQLNSAYSNLWGYFKTNMPGIVGGDAPVLVLRTASTTTSPTPVIIPTEDNPWWNTVRATQTTLCSNLTTTARMVYWSSLWFNRDGMINGTAIPHWTQTGYNFAGTNLANEISAPGSTFVTPNKLTILSVTPGNMLDTLTWTPPTVNYRWYRIYRSPSGSNAWTFIDQITNSLTSYIDASSITNGSAYDYQVNTLNEYAETAGVVVTNITPSGVVSPTPFLLLSSADGSSVTNLWNTLSNSNLVNGLNSFIPCTLPFNASGSTLYDLTTNRTMALTGVSISSNGISFAYAGSLSSKKAVTSSGVLPTNGPWSMLVVISNYISDGQYWVAESTDGSSANGTFNYLAGSGTSNGVVSLACVIDRTDFWSSHYQSSSTPTNIWDTGLHGFLIAYDGTNGFKFYEGSSGSPIKTVAGPTSAYTWEIPKKTLIGRSAASSGMNPQMDFKAIAVWNKDLSANWLSVYAAVKAGLGLP